MALRVPHGDLVRDQRLWYPLDWYDRIGAGPLPLFVFLDDGRGAVQFATDVGIHRLIRALPSEEPAFHPVGFDFSGIVALFLEPPDVTGRTVPVRRWSTPAGATFSFDLFPGGVPEFPGDPLGSGLPGLPGAASAPIPLPQLGLLASSGNMLAFPEDDLGFLVCSVYQVIDGFAHTLGWVPRVDGAGPVIDESKIFLIGMGAGATLSLVALGRAANRAGTGTLFAGACVLGGTIGGKAINDPSGAFPGVQPVRYLPTLDVTGQRLLSIWGGYPLASPTPTQVLQAAMMGSPRLPVDGSELSSESNFWAKDVQQIAGRRWPIVDVIRLKSSLLRCAEPRR